MRTSIFALLAFLSFCRPSNGQAFWQEDFSQGPNSIFDWQTDDLSGNGALWQYCDNSLSCLPDTFFQSSTAANGFISVKSVLRDTHISRLISPKIDCSGKEQVILQFESWILTRNIHPSLGTLVKVRANGGNWKYWRPFPGLKGKANKQLGSKNAEIVTLDISAVAANQNMVEIMWEWTGKGEEFWALDDVQLFDYQPFYEKVVWGKNRGEGDFSGGLNGWLSVGVSGILHVWTWDSLGAADNSFLIRQNFASGKYPNYISSYSEANGAAIFNADYYTTRGASPPPPPYPQYRSELISPEIDLSNVADEMVLEFYQYAILLNPNVCCDFKTAVAYSNDGGLTWLDTIEINENLQVQQPANGKISIGLPGIEGKAKAKIKFIFSGDLFFWMVDDVVIKENLRHNLLLSNDFFAIAPNALTPASQVESIGFLVDFENIGAQNQSNLKVTVEIQNDLSGQISFSDTLKFASLDAGGQIQNLPFPSRFLPPSSPERYTATYRILADSTDQDPENNTIQWRFGISDTIFAKETGPTTVILPAFSDRVRFANCFYVPRGHGWYARQFSFGIGNPRSLVGEEVFLFLYKWRGDENGDFFANASEYELLTGNSYTIRGNELAENQGVITIPVSPSGEIVPLEDHYYYLAVLQYDGGGPVLMQVLASDAQNYGATWYLTNTRGTPRYAGLVDAEGVGDFDLFGFELKTVPVIRLHISQFVPTVGVENFISAGDFQLVPNPASAAISVLTENARVLKISFISPVGETLKTVELDRENEFFDILTADLPRGFIFVKIETLESFSVRKLVLN